MARSIWKGSIAFGLVSIPVELYSATRDHRPKFRMLELDEEFDAIVLALGAIIYAVVLSGPFGKASAADLKSAGRSAASRRARTSRAPCPAESSWTACWS